MISNRNYPDLSGQQPWSNSFNPMYLQSQAMQQPQPHLNMSMSPLHSYTSPNANMHPQSLYPYQSSQPLSLYSNPHQLHGQAQSHGQAQGQTHGQTQPQSQTSYTPGQGHIPQSISNQIPCTKCKGLGMLVQNPNDISLGYQRQQPILMANPKRQYDQQIDCLGGARDLYSPMEENQRFSKYNDPRQQRHDYKNYDLNSQHRMNQTNIPINSFSNGQVGYPSIGYDPMYGKVY